MQLLIGGTVVGLLEENVGAYACLLKFSVIFYRGGGDVHIHATDGSILVTDGVDGFDGIQHILYGAHLGVLARLQCQTLVSHVL